MQHSAAQNTALAHLLANICSSDSMYQRYHTLELDMYSRTTRPPHVAHTVVFHALQHSIAALRPSAHNTVVSGDCNLNAKPCSRGTVWQAEYALT